MNESLLHVGKHGPRGYGWKEIRMIASQFFTSVKMHQIFPIVYERIQTLASVIEMSLGKDHVLDIYKYTGVMIIIPAIGANWSPDYWLDPVKFEPERFLNYDPNPLTWLPFGIGPRSCVEMKLAEIEMKTTLVELLKRFRFDVHEKSQSTLKFRVSSVVMQPKDGVLLKITKRN
uniref:Cytochrome P450 n=1 Tax=Acrobeloides nanus TaxID=290746 RepID=A0A914DJ15_9BILA